MNLGKSTKAIETNVTHNLIAHADAGSLSSHKVALLCLIKKLKILDVIWFVSVCRVWFVRKVVEGTSTLAAIEKAETVNERPVKPISISNCGVSKCVF